MSNRSVRVGIFHSLTGTMALSNQPLGETHFAAIVDQICALQLDMVFNTLNGDSNFAFYDHYQAAGLTAATIPIMAVSIAEVELQQIGSAATGHYACWSYFQSLSNAENIQFVHNFQQRYGDDRVRQAAYRQEEGMVLYTDGITEAQSGQRQLYGIERLCEVVRQNWSLSATEIRQAVIEDVHNHIGSHKLFDDITSVVIKR